jgi:ubiquinol-cytochrome c reductase cytochrome c subunit
MTVDDQASSTDEPQGADGVGQRPARKPRVRRPRRASRPKGVFSLIYRPRRPQSKLRRRISSGARMIAALALVGGIYATFTPSVSAEDTPTISGAALAGQDLYNRTCISCHGQNAQGVEGRGPSLIGVGSASVELQVTTGRMPAAQQGAQIERKPPSLDDTQARQLGAYIQALGGGPTLPDGTNLHQNADLSEGGELFRVNCTSCHAFGGGGGALSSGKYAPSLSDATDRQMYAAMLTGPQNMPVFGDNQLSPQEKEDIIAYIQNQKQDQDPGGFGLGRLGPVPEGLVIFLVGMVFLVLATLWIAGKS